MAYEVMATNSENFSESFIVLSLFAYFPINSFACSKNSGPPHIISNGSFHNAMGSS